MRKPLLPFLIICSVQIYPLSVNAQSTQMHPTPTRTLLGFPGLIQFLLLLVFGFLLLRSFNQVRKANIEIGNLDKLRMSFINADDRLIYLKDEKSKYIFVNTAFEDFCQKSLCEITGPNGSDLEDNELADIW